MAKAVTLKNTSNEEVYPVTDASLVNGALATNQIADGAITQLKADMPSLTTMDSISVTRYFTPSSGWTFTGTMWKLGHFVFGTVETSHNISINQNNIGTCSNNIKNATYGTGRVGDGTTSYAATALAIPGGQLRLHSTHAGTSAAFTILLYVSD